MEHSFKLGSSEFRFSFNSERFDGHQFDDMDATMAAMNAKMDAEMAAMDARMAAMDAEMDAEIAAMDAEMAAMDAEADEFDEDESELVDSSSGSYNFGPLHVVYSSQRWRSRG